MENKNNPFNANRIEKVKVSMALAGHTKERLADLLNINRNTLAQKLKGNRPWSVVEIETLAQIYDKPRHYFF
jgi:transcriptional regulator with XRE-family HTH domain